MMICLVESLDKCGVDGISDGVWCLKHGVNERASTRLFDSQSPISKDRAGHLFVAALKPVVGL